MRITSFFLAEAIAQDSSGSFSAIRIGQNIVFAPTLPTTTKRATVLTADDPEDEIKEGDRVSIDIVVASPSGSVIVRNTREVPVGTKPIPDLPGQLIVPAEFMLELAELGKYVISASLKCGDKSWKEELPLYVIEPLVATPAI